MNKGEYENRLAGFSAMDKNKLAEYAVNCEAHIEALVDERDAALEREQVLAANFIALQDAATDLIHASTEEEAGDAMERIADCSEKQAREVIAKRDLIKQAEELEREANGWPEDKYTECSHVRESILESAKDLRQQAAAL